MKSEVDDRFSVPPTEKAGLGIRRENGGPLGLQLVSAESVHPVGAEVPLPVSSPPADPRDAFFQTHAGGLRKRTMRGAAVTLSSQAVKFSLRLLTIAILARLLAPSEFGLVAMVVAVTGLVELFKDAGLCMATVQRPTIGHREVSTLFWINVGIGFALAICVALVSPIIAWGYGEPRLQNIALAWALVPLCGGVTAQHQAIMQRKMQFRRLAAIEIGSMLLSGLAAIWAAGAGAGYWSLVILSVSAAAVTMLLSCLCSGWRPSAPSRLAEVMPLLKFGGNLAAFNVVNYFSRNGDNLLIGWRWGGDALGLYSRAYNLLTLPICEINAPIAAVVVPTLSRLHDSPEQYRRTYLSVVGNLALITMPMMGVLAVTSDWVIELILGRQWAGAAPIFSWLAIAGLIQPISHTVGWLFISQGRTNELFRAGMAYSVLAVAAFAAGLPFGPIGVAASYTLFDLLIRTPLLFYCVSLSGPVKMSSVVRILIRPAVLSVLVMLGIGVWRYAVPDLEGISGLASAVTIAALVMLPTIISKVAQHRSQLSDLLKIAPGRQTQLET